MKRMALTAWLVLAASVSATAAPLDPSHVPGDAKWVIHVDFEALGDTAFAEKLRAERPELIQHASEWLRSRYGIDPRQDLKGWTLFSNTYAAHTGASVLLADYDARRVKAIIEEQPGVEKTTWQDHTIYTWRLDDPKAQGRKLTGVLLDGGKAVFASSPELAKTAVNLLEGEGASLKDQKSPLTADVPKGAVIYGAAIDLGKIARRERAFPILQQHERITWATGERGDKAFETTVLEAKSAEVAQEMEKVLEGMVSLMRVWAGDHKNIRKLADEVEITRQGATVKAHWESDTETALAAFKEFEETVGPWLHSQGRAKQPRAQERKPATERD